MHYSWEERTVIKAYLFGLICTLSAIEAAEPANKDIVKLGIAVLPIKSLSGYQASDFYGEKKVGASSVAYEFVNGGRAVLLDVNGDGLLTEDKDLISFGSETTFVPIQSELIMPNGRYELVRVEKAKKLLVARVEPDAEFDRGVLGAMYFMNVVRCRNGMAPVRLDVAMSRACDAHAEYVATNHNKGMELHKENPSSPKYSKEGAAAAAGSSIYPGRSDLMSSMDGWIRSSWHSWPLMDPSTKLCGVTNKNNLCMFYRSNDSTYSVRSSEMFMPGKGARGVPLSFNSGEIPVPVPGKDTGSLGMPIIWRPVDANAKDYSMSLEAIVNGKPSNVDGYFSSPSAPANAREWPTNSGLHIFVPAAALLPNTEYGVTIKRSGKMVLQYKFVTGGDRDYLSSVSLK